MTALKRILRIISLVLLALGLLVLAWWFWPERTPSIRSSDNTSVATIDNIQLGGVEQCVLIRSENTDNPILLFLHGGPGMPMMYLAHEFQRPLEADFTVVQWDRRGAGKTFSRNKPSPESMNTRQLVDDAYALIDTLRTRYKQDRVLLVGHSFGTYLGSIMASERPELFHAYISIGQVVDDARALPLQVDFIRERAQKENRLDILASLDKNELGNIENWLFEFGGELKYSTSFFPLIWSGLQAPEYTMAEALDLAKGSSFSSLHIKSNILEGSIYQEIRQYDIPVYFFVGTSDFTTPHALVREYYDLVQAPHKEIVYFRESAHFPFFEEPETFCLEVKRVLKDIR